MYTKRCFKYSWEEGSRVFKLRSKKSKKKHSEKMYEKFLLKNKKDSIFANLFVALFPYLVHKNAMKYEERAMRRVR